jgi:hypothetical protein
MNLTHTGSSRREGEEGLQDTVRMALFEPPYTLDATN